MGLLKKIFGGATIDSVRRALADHRWAEALAAGKKIDRASFDEATAEELARLLAEAGDGLAAFNLEEAEACLHSGETERALEHLELATSQACSAELAERISEQLQNVGKPADTASGKAPAADSSCCASGCGPVAAKEQEPAAGEIGLDEQTHLDLILATYPPEVAERYEQATATFKRAFLLAHEDQEEAAAELLEEIAEQERDDLFFFERGALRSRLGKPGEARADLEKALQQNPDLSLALDALVRLLVQTEQFADAEKRLRAELEQGRHSGYCFARLAELETRRGEFESALQLATRALEEGHAEPETILLTASLLERHGRLDEAEGLLARLGGGGCSGGFNVHLAEFSLRHRRNLGKALEAFKAAARQEPDQPRWILRMAQVSLARGWRKDGERLLRQALDDPRLDEDLRAEAEELLPA